MNAAMYNFRSQQYIALFSVATFMHAWPGGYTQTNNN